GLALVATLFYGSHFIQQGTLTTGQFVSFLAALFLMYTPVKRLSQMNASLQGALAAGARVFGLLDAHEEVKDETGASALPRMTRELEYRDVGFRYSDGQGAVLRRIGFRAGRGAVVAIVGTTGAGKRT